LWRKMMGPSKSCPGWVLNSNLRIQ
jgi:hypothetical protein